MLQTLYDCRFTGALSAENMWHKVTVDFVHGQPAAVVDHGVVPASGQDAFLALCEVTAGELQLWPQPAKLAANIDKPFSDLLEWAEHELTDAERRVVDTNLVTAGALKIDAAALDFFSQLAPSRLEPLIQLLRQNKLPREILATLELPPTEIEEILRDLVRKHIIQFD